MIPPGLGLFRVNIFLKSIWSVWMKPRNPLDSLWHAHGSACHAHPTVQPHQPTAASNPVSSRVKTMLSSSIPFPWQWPCLVPSSALTCRTRLWYTLSLLQLAASTAVMGPLSPLGPLTSPAFSDITIAESASHAICYVPHLLLFSLFSLYSLLLSVQFPIANLSDMLFSLTQRGWQMDVL